AMALCDRVGDDAQRAQIIYGLQSLQMVQARLEKVGTAAAELDLLYRRIRGSTAPLESEMMVSGMRLHLGQIAEASDEFDRMLARHDVRLLQRIVEEQGWNCAVHGRVWQAHAQWLLGHPDRALERALEGTRLAEEIGHPFNRALAATYLAMLQQLRA